MHRQHVHAFCIFKNSCSNSPVLDVLGLRSNKPELGASFSVRVPCLSRVALAARHRLLLDFRASATNAGPAPVRAFISQRAIPFQPRPMPSLCFGPIPCDFVVVGISPLRDTKSWLPLPQTVIPQTRSQILDVRSVPVKLTARAALGAVSKRPAVSREVVSRPLVQVSSC
ncbi:hypothetical protein VUR80DRAFT_9876 [Thermomyces stellatus]